MELLTLLFDIDHTAHRHGIFVIAHHKRHCPLRLVGGAFDGYVGKLPYRVVECRIVSVVDEQRERFAWRYVFRSTYVAYVGYYLLHLLEEGYRPVCRRLVAIWLVVDGIHYAVSAQKAVGVCYRHITLGSNIFQTVPKMFGYKRHKRV